MARSFRLWGKKRGERRTGSSLQGSVGEAIFFAVLFVAGSLLLSAQLATQAIQPSASLAQPGFGYWLSVLVFTSCIVIGAIGLVYTTIHARASAERRSALARRATNIDLTREGKPSPADFPNVPRDANLTNSPGVLLAYRLPTAESSAWRVVATTVLALLSTGIAIALLVVTIENWMFGDPIWLPLLVAIPFVGGSIWSAAYVVRQLWLNTQIGPTCVEISDLPLRPGGEYEIFLSQSGQFRLPSMRMAVVCEEEATFSHGTDIRTETHVVFEEPIFVTDAIQVEPGYPFEMRSSLRIPAAAMHSFQSAHNAVRWKLTVAFDSAAGPSRFVRSFPLLVYPHANGPR